LFKAFGSSENIVLSCRQGEEVLSAYPPFSSGVGGVMRGEEVGGCGCEPVEKLFRDVAQGSCAVVSGLGKLCAQVHQPLYEGLSTEW